MTTFERLRGLILDTFGGGPVLLEPETPVADAVSDSLDMMELAMQIEDEFAIGLDDDEIAAAHTLADLAAIIDRATGTPGVAA